MTVLRWIVAELRFRSVGTAVALFGIVIASAVAVALTLFEDGFERETRRIVRDIGFNVRIIPKETDLDRFYLEGYSELTIPEDAVHRLAAAGDISYNHLVATLKKKLTVTDKTVFLLGVSPTYFPKGRKKKSPMMFAVEPGTAHVGSRIAEASGATKGGTITLGAESFRVARVMPKTSTPDDVTIYTHLADAQRVLSLEGRINEIKAIDCLCLTADENPAAILERELAAVLPEARVFHLSTMADARARQRQTVEELAAVLVPMVALAACLMVAVLAFINVRDRRSEIGVLRALGYGGGRVLALFLGKATVLGVIGGGLGFALGTTIALSYGQTLFELTAKAMKTDWSLLGWSLLLTPMFAIAASFLPTLIAVRQEPSQNLGPQ